MDELQSPTEDSSRDGLAKDLFVLLNRSMVVFGSRKTW